jgi:hypothetical protein
VAASNGASIYALLVPALVCDHDARIASPAALESLESTVKEHNGTALGNALRLTPSSQRLR